MKSNLISLIVVFICTLVLFLSAFVYYPKYQADKVEKTISWDVSGYYMYLPALFIYKDIKQVGFLQKILDKYHPTPDPQQILKLPNGNQVMKYPAGQAVQFLPFFAIAHWYALNSDYEADGFSSPYQFMISLEAIFVAFIGLIFLRLILLQFFKDKIVAVCLLGLVLGTNYLEYASITGAMTHNNLFTLYTLIIYLTMSFYRKPTKMKSIGIGLLIGLAALTRPTEIITCLIPLLWGISFPIKTGIRERFEFIKSNFPIYLLMAFAVLVVGSIQLIYWKYVSGDFLVYSYGAKQTFSWLSPHIKDGLLSYKSGWLVYSPLMILSLIGFWHLRKKAPKVFLLALTFSLLFIYITFSWDIWWYGGSLGSRPMVQAYPILAFPLASLLDKWWKQKWHANFLYFFIPLCIYYNFWLTHQAHLGGKYYVSQMTSAYFWKVLGTYEINENDLKLLDTDEEFRGERKDVYVLFSTDFENFNRIHTCDFPPINGNKSLCVDETFQKSPLFSVSVDPNFADWARGKATFKCPSREWDTWKMAQLIVSFYHDTEIVKSRKIRLHRILKTGDQKTIYLDVKAPKEAFNTVCVQISNGGGSKPLIIDDLAIEVFKE